MGEVTGVKTTVFKNIFFVHWRRPPTLEMAEAVMRDFQQATQANRSPIYCGISGDGAGSLNAEMQRKMASMCLSILEKVPEFYLVLGGQSTQASLSRSMIRGMVTAARLGNRVLGFDPGRMASKITVFDSLEGCLARVAASEHVGASLAALRAEAERQGFFER